MLSTTYLASLNDSSEMEIPVADQGTHLPAQVHTVRHLLTSGPNVTSRQDKQIIKHSTSTPSLRGLLVSVCRPSHGLFTASTLNVSSLYHIPEEPCIRYPHLKAIPPRPPCSCMPYQFIHDFYTLITLFPIPHSRRTSQPPSASQSNLSEVPLFLYPKPVYSRHLRLSLHSLHFLSDGRRNSLLNAIPRNTHCFCIQYPTLGRYCLACSESQYSL